MLMFTVGLLWLLPALVAAFDLQNFANIDKRISAEAYECHEDCGTVILISQGSSDYCDNSTFTTDLQDCLECALTYDIWQYYGDDVSSAAEDCGLDATPSSASSSAATATATATTAATTAPASASASATLSSAVTTASSNVTITSGNPTATAASATATFTGGASRLYGWKDIPVIAAIGLGLAFF